MPRDGSGNYTLPNAAFVAGVAISPVDVNENFADIAAELTDSLSRSGDGAMNVPLPFDDGTEAAPAISFASDTNMGFWRASAAVWAGSRCSTNSLPQPILPQP